MRRRRAKKNVQQLQKLFRSVRNQALPKPPSATASKPIMVYLCSVLRLLKEKDVLFFTIQSFSNSLPITQPELTEVQPTTSLV